MAIEAEPLKGAVVKERIVIAGSSGLIGTALTESLRSDGIPVVALVRRPARSDHEITWDPREPLDPAHLDGARALVNLGGASIGRLPWTRGYRQTLHSSRIQTTLTLAQAVEQLAVNNRSVAPHFISASAVGFYGHRPGEALTEASSAGVTFLARLSAEWEDAARSAGEHARVTLLRTAPILHPQGVLKPMITLTKLGLGGRLGRGNQIWPWISLDDQVRAIRHVIDHAVTGPVNLTGPVTATATDIGRALAKRLGRPFLIPAPAWALRLGLGRDAAESLILTDAQVTPERLLTSDFRFLHETPDEAIAASIPA